jgi:hypothetical protein
MKTSINQPLPSLHHICEKNDLQEYKQYIQFKRFSESGNYGEPGMYAVATDARLLIHFNLSSSFSPEFIAGLPDEFLIHCKQFAILTGAKPYFLEYENKQLKVCDKNGDLIGIAPIILAEDANFRYPHWTQILPVHEYLPDANMINYVSFGLDVLEKLVKSVNGKQIVFKSNGTNDQMRGLSIVVHDYDIKGIIMPMSVTIIDRLFQ